MQDILIQLSVEFFLFLPIQLKKYKKGGGILGLDKELQDQLNEDGDNSRGSSTDTEMPSLSELPKQEAIDNAPPLPARPPGKPLFTKQPSLINELYPPFAELSPQGTVFDGVEKILLNQYESEALSQVICSQWLSLCYQTKPCPMTVWQWLFQIMCRSCDLNLVHGAYVNLVDLVKTAKLRKDISSIYCPSFAEVMDILVSLGMDKNYLPNESSPEIDEVFTSPQPPIGNLSRLLQYLKLCAQIAPHKYSVQDLECLVVLLANVSLDAHVCQELISRDFTSCLNCLVAAISASDWACSVDRLGTQLSRLSPHHHNKLYLTGLVTGMTQRLSELQMNLCRKNIELLLEDKVPGSSSLPDCSFSTKVLKYYFKLKSSDYNYEMCYSMHSVLTMLSLFLNKTRVVWPDQASEREFGLVLGALSDKLQDHYEHPERGAVKDLVIRMKVDYEVKKTKKQRDIKDYFS